MLLVFKTTIFFATLCLLCVRAHTQFTYLKQIPKKQIEYISPTDYELFRNGGVIENIAKRRSENAKYTFTEKGKKDTIFLDASGLPKELKRQISIIADNQGMELGAPNEFKQYEWFQSEYSKVQAIAKKERETRDTSQMIAILNRIQFKSESLAKYWLGLKAIELYVSIEQPFDVVESVAGGIIHDFETLKDDFVKGQCYKIVGDWYARWTMYRPAMDMYYTAREHIYNSKTTEKKKNIANAEIIESTASLFGDLNSTYSNIKATEYYKSAYSYFEAAEDNNGSTRVLLAQKANESILYSNDWRLNTKENNLQLIKDIWNWFTEYERLSVKNGLNPGTNYWGLFTIARILQNQNKVKEAIPYYLETLFCAIGEQNTGKIFTSLVNIATAYFSIGDYQKGSEYLDLKLFLAKKLPDRYQMYSYNLDKATEYLFKKKYDSAMRFTDIVLSDTLVRKRFYLSRNLYVWADRIKVSSLDSLGILIDSARIYERALNSHLQYGDNEFSQLVQIESNYIQGWLKRIRDKDVLLKERLIAIQKQNAAIREKNAQLALASAYTLNEQIKKQKVASDSIAYLNDSLRKGSEIQRITSDSLNEIKQRNLSIENQNVVQKNKVFGWLLVSAVVGILLAISAFYNSKYRASLKDSKRVIEFNRINELAKNKIHNIQNDYSEIGNLLEQNDFVTLKKYNKAFEAFLAIFLANWKKEDFVSLHSELEGLDRYVKVQQVLNPNLLFVKRNHVPDCEHVIFIQSVFDTLLHNAVKHAFKDKSVSCVFTLEIKVENNFLLCTVSDNGKPSQIDSYFRNPNRGLSILKSRVANLYFGMRQKLPLNYFQVKINQGDSGTTILIQLPYEKAESFHS